VTTSLCAWVDSLQNNLQNRCSQWKWLHIHKHITYTVWCCCTLSFCIHIDRCFVWRGLEVCCVMSIKFVHSWICPSICTLMIEDFEFFVSKYMFFSWSKIGEPVTCIDILHRELSPSLTSPRYIRTHVYAYMNCWNIFTNWAIHLPNRTFFLRIYWSCTKVRLFVPHGLVHHFWSNNFSKQNTVVVNGECISELTVCSYSPRRLDGASKTVHQISNSKLKLIFLLEGFLVSNGHRSVFRDNFQD
jgi:hypothetical protein